MKTKAIHFTSKTYFCSELTENNRAEYSDLETHFPPPCTVSSWPVCSD